MYYLYFIVLIDSSVLSSSLLPLFSILFSLSYISIPSLLKIVFPFPFSLILILNTLDFDFIHSNLHTTSHLTRISTSLLISSTTPVYIAFLSSSVRIHKTHLASLRRYTTSLYIASIIPAPLQGCRTCSTHSCLPYKTQTHSTRRLLVSFNNSPFVSTADDHLHNPEQVYISCRPPSAGSEIPKYHSVKQSRTPEQDS